MTTEATTADELPVYFESGDETLFGVLTYPTAAANGFTLLLLNGGGWVPAHGRNSKWARLARKMAAQGYHTFRIDYAGVGESTGFMPFFELSRPRSNDVLAAVDWLAGEGLDQVVLVGTCYGGRAALAAADKIPSLKGMALVAVPIEDYLGSNETLGWHLKRAMSKKVLRRFRLRWRKYVRIAVDRGARLVSDALRKPKRKVAVEEGTPAEAVSPLFLEPLVRVVERRIPVLIMHGTADAHYEAFTVSLDQTLGKLIETNSELVGVNVNDGYLHGHLTLDSQDITIDCVAEWLDAFIPAADQPEGRVGHGL